MDEASGHEPELTGRNPNPRKYYSGRDQWEREGLHVHGDASDFLGRSLTEKYFHAGVTAHEPCGQPHIHFNLIMIGNLVEPEVIPFELFLERLMLGTIVEPAAVAMFAAGLELGTIVDQMTTSEEFFAGLELGTIVVPEFELRLNGIELGTIVEPVPLSAEARLDGIELGTIVEPVELLTAVHLDGIELGTIVEPVELLTAVHLDGIELGTIVEPVELLTEVRLDGLAVGDLVLAHVFPPDTTPVAVFYDGLDVGNLRDDLDDAEEFSEGLNLGDICLAVVDVVTPGADCDHAAAIAFLTNYTFSITSPTNHWFKFSAVSGTQYFVKMTLNSGSGANANAYTGTCAGPTLRITCTPPSFPCGTYTPGSATTFMIKISGSLFGTCNYTLRCGTGACP